MTDSNHNPGLDNLMLQAALKDARAGFYGPRVMLSSGIATATRSAVNPDDIAGVLVREDGWRLAFRDDTEQLARSAWADQWVGLVRRIKGDAWEIESINQT